MDKKKKEKKSRRKWSSVKIVQPQAFVKLDFCYITAEWTRVGLPVCVSAQYPKAPGLTISLFFKKEQASCFI